LCLEQCVWLGDTAGWGWVVGGVGVGRTGVCLSG